LRVLEGFLDEILGAAGDERRYGTTVLDVVELVLGLEVFFKFDVITAGISRPDVLAITECAPEFDRLFLLVQAV